MGKIIELTDYTIWYYKKLWGKCINAMVEYLRINPYDEDFDGEVPTYDDILDLCCEVKDKITKLCSYAEEKHDLELCVTLLTYNKTVYYTINKIEQYCFRIGTCQENQERRRKIRTAKKIWQELEILQDFCIEKMFNIKTVDISTSSYYIDDVTGKVKEKSIDTEEKGKLTEVLFQKRYKDKWEDAVWKVKKNNGIKGKSQARPITGHTKSFRDFLIGNDEEKERILKNLHDAIDGKKGKNVTLILFVAYVKGKIIRPTYSAVVKEFGEIGSKTNFNRYFKSEKFTREEIDNIHIFDNI